MKIKPALPEWGCSCNTESARNIDFADCKGTSRSGLSWSGVGSSLCSPGIRWPSSLRRRKSIKNGRVAKMMHFRFHYLVLSIYHGLDISHMMVCQIQVAIHCRNCNKKGTASPWDVSCYISCRDLRISKNRLNCCNGCALSSVFGSAWICTAKRSQYRL